MFYYRLANKNLMVMNPNIFIEAAGHLFVNFRLWLIDIGIRTDVNGYKINLVDY